MKRFLTAFGFVIPLVVLVFAVFYGYIVYQGSGVEEDNRTFVDRVTPLIISSMDRDTFMVYADEQLMQSADAGRVDRIFSWFRTLGKLQNYQGCNGKVNVGFSLSGISFSADCTAKAVFENGEAVITVSTIRRGGSWKISGFGISSPVLTQSSNERLHTL